MIQTLITVIHVFTCILLVCVVLLQSGKGAEISASFSGSSQTVFGSSGGANFFTHFTQGAAAVFMITSVALTLLGAGQKKSIFETTPASSAPISAPAGAAPGATTPVPPTGAANAPSAATPPADAKSGTNSAPANSNKK